MTTATITSTHQDRTARRSELLKARLHGVEERSAPTPHESRQPRLGTSPACGAAPAVDARTLRIALAEGTAHLPRADIDLLRGKAPRIGVGDKVNCPPSFAVPHPRCVPAPQHGYPAHSSAGCTVEAQRAALGQLKDLHACLEQVRVDYRDWKASNPNVREPSDGTRTLGDILEADMPVDVRCVHIVIVIAHECPGAFEHAGGASETAPTDGHRGEMPTQQAPSREGDFISYLGETFGPLLQALGPVAQLLGGLLSSPIGAQLLTAACAVIPGAQVLLPFIPVIAPVAGALLSGVGGMASGAPGGGPDLQSVVSGLSGFLGGVGGLAGPGALPLPGSA